MGLKYTKQSHRMIRLVVGWVVVMLIGIFFFSQPKPTKDTPIASAEETAIPAVEEQQAEPTEESEQESDNVTPAKRIVHVPDTRSSNLLTKYR